MVLAYHLVFTAYGHWLPNDPRGSWSDFVRSWELFLAAGPTPKFTPKPSTSSPNLHHLALKTTAQSALRYSPVTFTTPQRAAIAEGFQHAISRSDFTLHACSILPTHIHAVVARHRYSIEQVMNQLKGEASKALTKTKCHPFESTFLSSGKRHSPWAEDGWDVYLYTPTDIQRSITYVQENPLKENLPPQPWPFLRPYSPRTHHA